MTKQTLEQQVEHLVGEMKVRVVDFAFEKVDGTVRHASGTLMSDAIESFIGSSEKTNHNMTKKEPNPDVVVYFDVEAEAFRSFRKDRFLGIVDE